MQQASGGLHGKWNAPGAAWLGQTGEESRSVAAVDVAFGKVLLYGFVTGDRLQRHARKIPIEVQGDADRSERRAVRAIGVEQSGIEARDELVAAGLDDVGAEEGRRAIQAA